MKYIIVFLSLLCFGCASTSKRVYSCSIVDGGKELIFLDKKYDSLYDAEIAGEVLKISLQIEKKLQPTAYVDCFKEVNL